MKKIISFLCVLFALTVSAQHTISGTFSPAEDYTWLIAYRLKPGTQVYVADTAIKNGKFSMTIPENAEAGTYRLVYAVPQEEYNFDIIYNGKENIEFNFNSDDGPTYYSSIENSTFSTYLSEITQAEQEFVKYYTNQESNEELYSQLIQNITAIQNKFETNSDSLLAYTFIIANKPYIPTKLETVEAYVQNKKEHFFDTIDFQNSVLQSSTFLTDKISNYVFTALPVTSISKEITEQEIITNVTTANTILKDTSASFRLPIFNDLWNYAITYGYNTVSDFIYSEYLKDLANETQNIELIKTIEAHNRLRLGAVAPEIKWKKGNQEHKISEWNVANTYVLIFWSSTCGHCLNEIPKIKDALLAKPNLKVLAIGLEDNIKSWELESSKFEGFEHSISLGKWDSEYADLYDIHATPSYFILDKDKKIIAKPDSGEAVLEFLKKIY